MTFEELRLCMAIHSADIGGGDRPREQERHDATVQVFESWLKLFKTSVFPWSVDDVIRWAGNYRRRPENKIKVEVALTHGCVCYFSGRNKGPCSVEAEWGHVIPRSDGGPDTVANGQIECSAHNCQRSDMSIEEYLKSEKTTDGIVV